MITAANSTVIPINSVTPHPENPRTGNVEVIAESLRVNGQYKPILVNVRTGRILAGTHTWKAAASLGWTTIGASYVDVDEDRERQIMLTDNRAADAGLTDEAAVFNLLATLPDLHGTGYAVEDLRLPEVSTDDLLQERDTTPAADPEEGEDAPEEAPPVRTVPFTLGTTRAALLPGVYDPWRATLPKKGVDAARELLDRLGLVEPTRAAEDVPPELTTALVPISDLKPYPGNPRQGDVGRLMNSLMEHGQFRPIVANRRTRHILAGNHLTQAAARLGWTEIAVSWVDVDAEGERRIVIVDNRASDLSGYNTQALAAALTGVPAAALERGTGFTLEDLDDLLNGRGRATRPVRAETTLRIGNVKASVRTGLLKELNLRPGWELQEIAAMLNINIEGIVTP